MKKLPVAVATCALALSLLLPISAHAWGAQGHRLIARLASTELTAGARRQVAQLLAGEADPTLAGIAVWADELRRLDPDLGKRSAHWHYINLGDHDCTYLPARDCVNGDCVVQALTTQTAILGDPSQPHAARRQALKFVVHFVGDLHQPLHAARASDKGGNRIQVRFQHHGSNLHALWDSGMLHAQRLDDDAYLARLLALPPASVDSAPVLPPASADWAQAACRIALTPGLYPPSAIIADDYADTWRPLAESQLRLAGKRLAAILNASLSRS